MAGLDLGLGDFIFFNSHKVSVKNHEISIFSYFYTPFVIFEEAAFGYPNGDGA